jgi:hypothetical protein
VESAPGDFASLQRLLRTPPPTAPGERCDYCGVPVGGEHGHCIDLTVRRIMCSCRPCYLVFEPAGAAQGRYKTVPSRYAEIPDFAVDDAAWDQLQIPIGLAFFFINSREDRTLALYPGPAGATESQLSLEAWSALSGDYPAIATLQPDVEAVLVLRRAEVSRCFIVPIDAAYRLVGLIRTSWKGFDGGAEAWSKIDGFFAEMHERSSGAPRAAARW